VSHILQMLHVPKRFLQRIPWCIFAYRCSSKLPRSCGCLLGIETSFKIFGCKDGTSRRREVRGNRMADIRQVCSGLWSSCLRVCSVFVFCSFVSSVWLAALPLLLSLAFWSTLIPCLLVLPFPLVLISLPVTLRYDWTVKYIFPLCFSLNTFPFFWWKTFQCHGKDKCLKNATLLRFCETIKSIKRAVTWVISCYFSKQHNFSAAKRTLNALKTEKLQ